MTVSVSLTTTTPGNGETFGLEASGLPDEPVYVEMDGVGDPTRLFDPFSDGSVVLGIRSAASDVDEVLQLKKASDDSDLGSPISITVGSPAAPPVVTAPGTPTGLALTAGDTTISARCTAPASDGGSSIIDYVWRRGGVIIARTSSTAYLFTGLTNGTSYSITVSAENSAGEGSQTGSVSATPVALVPGPIPGGEPAEASPTETAALAAAVAAGGSVTMLDRIYRLKADLTNATVISASDTGKAEWRGSDIWTGWSGTGPWTSTLTVPAMPMADGSDGRYRDDTSQWPEQVFLDSAPLTQVASGVVPGALEFKVDATRHIVLGSNPSGHRIEVSTRRYWIHTTANLTLHGLYMRHAANEAQAAGSALKVSGGRLIADDGWLLAQCHGALLGILGGSGHQLTDGRWTEAGQAAYNFTSGLSGLLAQRIEIDHCNDQGYDPFWEAGAGKSSGTSGVVFDDYLLHDIDGVGLWWDIAPNTGAVARGGQAYNVALAALMYEISSGVVFEDNKIWECGWGDGRGWGWPAGILVSSSGHSTVRNNKIAWCPVGVSFVGQTGGNRDTVSDKSTYLQQYGQLVACRSGDVALGGFQDYVGPMFTSATNLGGTAVAGGTGGRYSSGASFRWANVPKDLAGINATSIEEGATGLSVSAMAALLAAAGMPTTGTH